MLHIILLILKIIGIILACIIGFVLLLLGLVLFVAIKYRGAVDFDGKPLYKVKVWWIPGIVSVFIDNENGKNRIRVKVFGITVKDNGKEKDSKENKKSKKKKTSDDVHETHKAETEKVEDASKESEKSEDLEETKAVETDLEKIETAGDDLKKEDEIIESADTKSEKETKKSEKKALKAKKKTEKKAQKEAGDKKSFEEKIEDVKKAILAKLDAISEKFKALKAKADKIHELFFSPQGKKMLFKIKIALIKLVKHLLPTKLKGKLYLGMGDAYKTANTLTYIAAFYPIWSPTFEIIPDFQEKITEGHIQFKGRIRLGYIVWLALVLIMDKHLRYTIKELKKLKG